MFDNPSYDNHEGVHFFSDEASGLRAVIAIHSTALGPSSGGTRMWDYPDSMSMVTDVLRLSQGMSYKNAMASIPHGGGKAVIWGNSKTDKSEALFRAFGRAVDSLQGRYWTAEDVGIDTADIEIAAQETRYAAGLTTGAAASGDPSPVTARGIFNAVRVTARHRFGSGDLSGKTVSVQGLGHVGEHLCALLHDAGAKLVITDIDAGQTARLGDRFAAQAVAPDAIYAAEADIFAPCAIGGILNETSIPLLKVGAVAGGANNQLATDADAQRLHDRGIIYAPDFVANGGGIVNVATEILKIKDREAWVGQRLEALERTMDRILTRAKVDGVSPHAVAESIVEEKLHPQAA